MNPPAKFDYPMEFDARPMGQPELAAHPAQRVFPGVESHLNVQFAAPLGFRPLYLDLHLPDNATGTPLATAVYAHGGGFLGGAKAMGPWRFLLDAGYAVASIDYRLSGEAIFPGPVHDFAAAVRFLRAHADDYGLDDRRLFGFGSSAGAYLAVAAALGADQPALTGRLGPHPDVSAELAAVVDHYAPIDFLTLDEDAGPDNVELADSPGSSADRFLGFMPSARPDEASVADLTRYVTATAPPFFIAHGTTDHRVGIGQSRRLRDALRAGGVAVEFHAVDGADHGGPQFDESAIQQATLEFLSHALGARA
jgi:acetyl esterase/lipase